MPMSGRPNLLDIGAFLELLQYFAGSATVRDAAGHAHAAASGFAAAVAGAATSQTAAISSGDEVTWCWP